MSKPKYSWWGYVRQMIRRYPLPCRDDAISRREQGAVRYALEQTARHPDGAQRIALVRMVYWEKNCTLEQAAQSLYISGITARRWHSDFIRTVARAFGLMDGAPLPARSAPDSTPRPPGLCHEKARGFI